MVNFEVTLTYPADDPFIAWFIISKLLPWLTKTSVISPKTIMRRGRAAPWVQAQIKPIIMRITSHLSANRNCGRNHIRLMEKENTGGSWFLPSCRRKVEQHKLYDNHPISYKVLKCFFS